MNITLRPSAPLRLRRPRLDRDVAMTLAATEYDRFLDLLRDLSPQEWHRPTDCEAWDVRARHRRWLEGGRPLALVALSALQVAEHAHLTTDQLIDRLATVGPAAARARRRMPALVRQAPLPGVQTSGDVSERWTIGYLNDIILTRDPWMHRMDICRATGREPLLTTDHDGVLVADVVLEWAYRHDLPFRLELTGPAGGYFGRGPEDEAGEPLRLDAVDFCRVLSGRPADHPGHELLEVAVPF